MEDLMYANRKITNWKGFLETPIPTSTFYGTVNTIGGHYDYRVVKAHGFNMCAYIDLPNAYNPKPSEVIALDKNNRFNYSDKECVGWDYAGLRFYDHKTGKYTDPSKEMVMREIQSSADWIDEQERDSRFVHKYY